jgi:hypothetical protein
VVMGTDKTAYVELMDLLISTRCQLIFVYYLATAKHSLRLALEYPGKASPPKYFCPAGTWVSLSYFELCSGITKWYQRDKGLKVNRIQVPR